jgi:hypothetical protein
MSEIACYQQMTSELPVTRNCLLSKTSTDKRWN